MSRIPQRYMLRRNSPAGLARQAARVAALTCSLCGKVLINQDKFSGHYSRSHRGICCQDNQLFLEHPRCDACGILVGERHENHHRLLVQTDAGLKRMCPDCWLVWQVRVAPLGMPWGVWIDTAAGDPQRRWMKERT